MKGTEAQKRSFTLHLQHYRACPGTLGEGHRAHGHTRQQAKDESEGHLKTFKGYLWMFMDNYLHLPCRPSPNQ